ncbi:uncharacterized protein LOC132746709 [Ruditapes philippinarum]|uniref:uncharacterized protein LOC132746709 n=1 Tax=Ruditapes philippinarum TaxID=129788 RepID=UPI00295AF316|nr:uncharacterized protein LOC132746709 [Ruditapes philippinarum]
MHKMKGSMGKFLILRLGFITVLMLTLVIVYETEKGQCFLKWCLRKTLIHALGDTELKRATESRCLVQNMYKKNYFDDNICELCENNSFEEINTNVEDDISDSMHLEVPLVINNSVKSFENSLRAFAQLFLLNEKLELFQPCQFKSNIKSKVREHRQLLQLVSSGKIKSFYSLWENCADISYKAFRQFYERPTILGNNVQLTGTNWAFMCSDFESKMFRNIETFSQIVTLLVQKGSVEIRLVPIEGCLNICSTLTTYISSRDMLVFSGNLYSLYIRPSCYSEEILLIGVGGYID